MIPPSLAISLFGPLHVTVRGEPLPRVRTRSVEWLLALLALRHGRAVSRGWLATTLWPESDASRSLQNLRDDLMRLRKALGPEAERIQSPARDQLTLDLSEAVVDVVRFDRGIRVGDEASLQEAVVVYRGPLLEGCTEEWVLAERETRAEQCLVALETLANRAGERGDPHRAIGLLRQAQALDPLRDSLQQRLMANLARTGDPAAAIQSYRDFRLRLREVLLAEPEAATTRIFHEIRAAARAMAVRRAACGVRRVEEPMPSGVTAADVLTPHAARRTPHGSEATLPHPITTLIGREKEVAEVREQLRRSRLVTLLGGGGVGKTRLALAVAATAGEEFRGGAVWGELAPLADGALVLPALATAFGLRETGSDDPEVLTAGLIARLAEAAPLLVLDNCEHLLEAAARVVDMLLQHCPQLRVLATSRQRLGLAGEVSWRVPSLAVPGEAMQSPEPATLMQFAAVQLFVERAAAVRPGFRLATPEDAMAVGRICRRLDGIPLALELAAARASVLTPRQIGERLDNRFHLLTTGARSALPRHQTLRALIDWSYDSLPEAEAALLRRLSVFPGGWTLDAAEAIGGEDDGLTLLASLEERSLVLVEEGDEGMRYRMLETVREYAWEKLEGEEKASARAAHAALFLRLAEEAGTALERSEAGCLDRLEREHDNLRAALRWYLETRDVASGLRLAGALVPFWEVRFYLAEGQQWLESLLALPGAASAGLARARVLGGAGRLAMRQGKRVVAESYWEEALAICRQNDDRRGLAEILLQVGELEGDTVLSAGAAAGFEESLTYWREVGDRAAVARTLFLQARLATQRAAFPEARACHAEAAALYRELGDLLNTARNLRDLGRLSRSMGDYATAGSQLEESLSLERQLGNRVGVSETRLLLGQTAYSQGDTASARACWEDVLAVDMEKMGHGGYVTVCLANLDRVEGDLDGARARCEASLAWKQRAGPSENPAQEMPCLAELALLEGDEATARRWYEECVRRFEVWPAEEWSAIRHRAALWRLLRRQGDTAASRACYEQALAYHQTLTNPHLLAHSRRYLGVMAGPEGDRERARCFLSESLSWGREGEHLTIIVGCLQGLVELAVLEGEWERAARLGGALVQHAAEPPRLWPRLEQLADEEALHAIRTALGEVPFASAWTEGRALTLAQAIEAALS